MLRLGQTSSTGDPEGDIEAVSDTIPTPEQLQEAVERFRGPIQQVPPAYSAIKVNGQRAYKLARAGKEVVIEPRAVTINSLEIVDYNFPEAKLLTNVSSGTYVRTLVEDIGSTVGTGAYTTGLRRTTVGNFSIENAVAVQLVGIDTLTLL
jgi:tRNA pseudouridine55 synthase